MGTDVKFFILFFSSFILFDKYRENNTDGDYIITKIKI